MQSPPPFILASDLPLPEPASRIPRRVIMLQYCRRGWLLALAPPMVPGSAQRSSGPIWVTPFSPLDSRVRCAGYSLWPAGAEGAGKQSGWQARPLSVERHIVSEVLWKTQDLLTTLLSHFGRVKTLAFRRQLQHRLWSTTRMGYRHGARVFEIHRHFVWTTTYRKPVVTGEVGLRVRELVRQVCREDEAAAAAAM